MGAGRTRFRDGPLVRVAGAHHEVVLVQATLLVLVRHVHGVGDGRTERLLDVSRDRLLGEAEDREGVAAFLPRMRSSTSPAFWAEVRMYLGG